MRIDIASLSKDFVVSQREVAGSPHILVCPGKGKHQWNPNELHLRSLLLKPNGEIVSSGFPKFFNYRENPVVDSLIQSSVASGKAFYAQKLDGSLIIRTIINGQVVFRTRGSHNLGALEQPVISLIQEKYPLLLDPEFGSAINWSMLFEFVSPDHRVILSYSEPQLYFLGAMLMFYGEKIPQFYPAHTFEKLHQRMGVPIPTRYYLSGSLLEVTEKIKGWTNSEGIVLYIPKEDGSYDLAKIKTEEYLNLHALRFNLSQSKVEQVCWVGDIQSVESMRLYLSSLGLDWETTSFVIPIVEGYLKRRQEGEGEISEFISSLEAEGLDKLTDKRAIALGLKEICDEDNKLFSLGLFYLMGDKVKFEDAKLGYLIGIPAKSVKEYFKSGRAMLKDFNPGE
jgi:hypothetical protein